MAGLEEPTLAPHPYDPAALSVAAGAAIPTPSASDGSMQSAVAAELPSEGVWADGSPATDLPNVKDTSAVAEVKPLGDLGCDPPKKKKNARLQFNIFPHKADLWAKFPQGPKGDQRKGNALQCKGKGWEAGGKGWKSRSKKGHQTQKRKGNFLGRQEKWCTFCHSNAHWIESCQKLQEAIAQIQDRATNWAHFCHLLEDIKAQILGRARKHGAAPAAKAMPQKLEPAAPAAKSKPQKQKNQKEKEDRSRGSGSGAAVAARVDADDSVDEDGCSSGQPPVKKSRSDSPSAPPQPEEQKGEDKNDDHLCCSICGTPVEASPAVAGEATDARGTAAGADEREPEAPVPFIRLRRPRPVTVGTLPALRLFDERFVVKPEGAVEPSLRVKEEVNEEEESDPVFGKTMRQELGETSGKRGRLCGKRRKNNDIITCRSYSVMLLSLYEARRQMHLLPIPPR